LDGKIYFVGGKDGSSAKNIAERYDPSTNTWETLNSMSVARVGLASAVLNGKLYAIGGEGLSSVEVFDQNTGSWTAGVDLPSVVCNGTAISINDKIYLVGGVNSSNQDINQVLSFDPSTNQWTTKANMPTPRHGMKIVWFENRIWAIGGRHPEMSKVESYNPITDSWNTEAPLSINRAWPVAWVANNKIYAGGGFDGTNHRNTVVVYNPTTKQWSNAGNFPENKYAADAAVLNDQVYVIGGQTASGVFSNKVYAADLNASVEGVYDLYRKDGDAPVGTPVVQSEYADGSVTTSKLDATILKYLKPEITAQPQAQTVYAYSNFSYSVTAEGKYLTYQWKKDGVDLTGETNATLNITDANATLHDGNYSVVVSNDFGSEESNEVEVNTSSFQPLSFQGLKLWLDASEHTPTESYWVDKSGNGNNAFKNKNPTIVPEVLNGKSIMRYSGTEGEYHYFNRITDIRTAFWVIRREGVTGIKSLLGDATSFHFHGGTSNELFYPAEVNNFNLLRINGLTSAISSTTFSSTFTIISVRSVGKLSASNFSKDRGFNDRVWKGDLGELLIYNAELNVSNFEKIEGYLAHKWGLTGNLPADHPYKSKAP
jgi:hypothetical protein